ncbi:hypothetical protein QYM36_009864 [Artemia franciscana]|uniref:Uncharacterized protein n=1 Tax=Artemia franciscana TaxID=6661 RepID=A0AA88I3G7_ARTSF|nr:hypothetical protein QYM36_009864 [Artemia franciscana]
MLDRSDIKPASSGRQILQIMVRQLSKSTFEKILPDTERMAISWKLAVSVRLPFLFHKGMMIPLRHAFGMTSVSLTTEKRVCRRMSKVLFLFSLFIAVLISEVLNISLGRSSTSMAGLED